MAGRSFPPINEVGMSGMATSTPELERGSSSRGAPTPRGPQTPQHAGGSHTPSTHENAGSEHGFRPLSLEMQHAPTGLGRPPNRSQPRSVRPNSAQHDDTSSPDAPHTRTSKPCGTRPEAPVPDTPRQGTIQQASVSKPKSYPEFDDGDVIIISPTGRKWKLHSMILSNASPRLKELFTSTEPAKLSKKDQNDGKTVRWTLVMCAEPMTHEIDPNSVTFKWFMPLLVSLLPSSRCNNS